MDNSDVLFEITTKLDNQTLETLSTTPVWTAISTLINEHWWYIRSEHLVNRDLQARPDVDWKRVYYSLLASMLSPDDLQIVHGLDYLPSLLVLIEVYGEPNLASTEVERKLWTSVESEEVLDYLVDELFLDGSLELSFAGLQAAIDNSRVEMIQPMLYWVKLGEDEHGDKKATDRRLERVILRVIENQQVATLEVFIEEKIASGSASLLNAAVGTRRLDIVRLLLSGWYSQQTLVSAARIAVEMDWSEGLTLFLGKLDEKNWQGLFYKALEHGSGYIAEMLVSKRLASDLDERGWEDVLSKALANGSGSMVRYAVTRVAPTPILDPDSLVGRLRSAGGIIANEQVYRLMRDTPIGVSTLRGIYEDESVAIDLVRDQNPETWDRGTLRIFLRSLADANASKRRGISLAVQIASDLDLPDVNAILNLEHGTSLYHILIRLILIKRPSSLELTEWMEARRDPMIGAAAQLVLDHHATLDPELVPIRALLLCMLYPALTLQELTDAIREEGASHQAVLRAAILVGAHRGDE